VEVEKNIINTCSFSLFDIFKYFLEYLLEKHKNTKLDKLYFSRGSNMFERVLDQAISNNAMDKICFLIQNASGYILANNLDQLFKTAIKSS
jgi:hypothetical protein